MRPIKIPVGVIVFAAIWLVALCVPSVRELPGTFAAYRLLETPSDFEAASLANLVRQFPDDPTLAAWRAETDFQGGDEAAIAAKRARFPNDISICALEVRLWAGKLGPLRNARQSPNSPQRARWIEAAQSARAGGGLEPNNAFWPWMEAAYEFGAGRDGAALRAFERAGKGARFDDHASSTLAARLAVWERARLVPWDRKISLWASTPLPHLALMRGCAALVAQRARALKIAGADEAALNAQSDLLQAARLCRDDGKIVITTYVGEQVARASLSEFFALPQPTTADQPLHSKPMIVSTHYGVELARRWTKFARQKGRPDLAKRADFVGEPPVSRWLPDASSEFGLRAPWGMVALSAPSILITLGLTLAAGALVWLAGVPLQFEGERPTRGQVSACASFSFWFLAGGVTLFFAAYFRAFDPLDPGGFISSDSTLIFATIAALCWLLPVWLVNWNRKRKWRAMPLKNARFLAPFWEGTRRVCWGICALFALVFALDQVGWWDGAWYLTVSLSGPVMLSLTLVLTLVLEMVRWTLGGRRLTWERIAPSAPRRRAQNGKHRRWAALGLGLLAAIALALLWGHFPWQGKLALLFGAGVAAAGALALTGTPTRPLFAVQLAHRTLGVTLIVWSAVFLGVALAAWPLRAQLNASLERRIQIGDVAWMREQTARGK